MKKDISKKQNRYRLYNSITGKELAAANQLHAFRELYSESEARFLTIFDNRANIFMGGSVIFKDAEERQFLTETK